MTGVLPVVSHYLTLTSIQTPPRGGTDYRPVVYDAYLSVTYTLSTEREMKV